MPEEPETPDNTSEPADAQQHAQLYAVLSKLGVRTLRAEYSGYGDSGCIEHIKAFNRRECEVKLPGTPVPLPLLTTTFDSATRSYRQRTEERTLPLNEAVEQWFYDVLEERFPGWELDDGSNGVITIDVNTRSGRLSHIFNVPTTITEDF